MYLVNEKHTQDGHNHTVLYNFHGPIAEVIDVLKGISLVDEIFPRCTEIATDVQRQELEAALCCTFKDGQLEYLTVEVHGHISSELLWELLQCLQREMYCLSQGHTSRSHLKILGARSNDINPLKAEFPFKF